MLKMTHPEIEAPGQVLDKATYNTVYAPRGWVLMDEPTAFANDQLGRFVRTTDDLDKDEARALIAYRGGDYPDENATGEDARTAYVASFSDRPAVAGPATESPMGVVLKPYDPSAHTVDEVTTYLATADEDEQLRVLGAEEAGKNRVTITSWSPPAPEDDAAPAADAGQE